MCLSRQGWAGYVIRNSHGIDSSKPVHCESLGLWYHTAPVL
ncbi:hypothetical protein D777_01833 [Marinobacter nitratireducens]|uniref:Uncharacterized protein n=1 Tax=Marinobacter nitratireducens TaxID=1137280 RepID=A0A072N1D7_9GAMM|nr:hypothetical protein D777_01833 [Marinobacter nitratireducens]